MTNLRILPLISVSAIGLSLLSSAAVQAQDPSRSLYGTPGYTDMPSAFMPPVDYFGYHLSSRGSSTQASIEFQLTERLAGRFRYGYLEGQSVNLDANYDRSFDLRYMLAKEGDWMPAVTVGMTDFLGTGILGSEYLVASKHLLDRRMTVSAGLGWGRLGTRGGFSNPLGALSPRFDTRPGVDNNGGPTAGNQGGTVRFSRLFRGDAALFGAVDYKLNDQWSVSAEYSSDSYELEKRRNEYETKTPINLALKYRTKKGAEVGLHSFYGTDVAVSYSFAFNPGTYVLPSGLEQAPIALLPRSEANVAGWEGALAANAGADETAAAPLSARFKAEGLTLIALRQSGSHAAVTLQNDSWPSAAQAIGRAARLLANTLPADVETIELRLTALGVEVSSTRLNRRDLEANELRVGGTQSLRRAAIIGAPEESPLPPLPSAYPQTTFELNPYLDPSYFDPDNPIRADAGVRANFDFSPFAGWTLSAEMRQRVLGNRGLSRFGNDSVLPHVRTDSGKYSEEGGTALTLLTGEYAFRAAQNIYGRVTAGYLERMYGGVSTEVLWKPEARKYALGAELNYARKRNFDGGLGFQDYDVITGHLSGYYDFNNGYHGQIDVGQYLAADKGATFTLERRFDNGFRVAGYVTLTDVPFDDFGEGSFDKGIRITIPLSWATGQPTRRTNVIDLRPVQRDGGARLNVANRLYETISDADSDAIDARFGRFWR